MELFSSLFTDSVGLASVFTLVVLFAIPLVIFVYIYKAMQAK